MLKIVRMIVEMIAKMIVSNDSLLAFFIVASLCAIIINVSFSEAKLSIAPCTYASDSASSALKYKKLACPSQDPTRWYNFETLPQTDDFRWAAGESVHIGQSVNPIANWKSL